MAQKRNSNNASNNTDAPVKARVNATGSLVYFGYGTGKFGKEPVSQVSFIPDNADSLREELSALYVQAGTPEKWLPDFVAKDTDRINLKSRYDVTVIAETEDPEAPVRMTLKDFQSDYGNPKKGTRVKVVMNFKDGSLYPLGVKFEDRLEDIETYSIDSLFDF